MILQDLSLTLQFKPPVVGFHLWAVVNSHPAPKLFIRYVCVVQHINITRSQNVGKFQLYAQVPASHYSLIPPVPATDRHIHTLSLFHPHTHTHTLHCQAQSSCTHAACCKSQRSCCCHVDFGGNSTLLRPTACATLQQEQ